MVNNRLYLAVVFVLLLTAAGCIKVNPNAVNQGPATLSEVTTATAVSADGQPTAVASLFLASTPTIYISAKVNNAPDNTTVGVKWI